MIFLVMHKNDVITLNVVRFSAFHITQHLDYMAAAAANRTFSGEEIAGRQVGWPDLSIKASFDGTRACSLYSGT